MFVFNTMKGDLRVHRQARTLAQNGYEVRVYCFLEPGLPELEKRAGYTIHRIDQRPWITRFFDDRILRRWARKGGVTDPLPLTSVDPGHAPPAQLPADRPPVRPCPQPAPRSYRPGDGPGRAAYRAYVALINQRWAAAAAAWGAQILQAHDVDALEAAASLAEKASLPLVFDAHEIWNEQPFVHDEEEAHHWKALERRWIGKASAVFTVNQPIATWMEQEYGVGQVHCLYNCQDLEPCPTGVSKLSERTGGRPVALYQGVIGWDRGLEELLAASARQNEVVLAIRGPGERLPALRQMAEQQGLEVLFLDSVPSDQVVAAAAQADIGLIPFLPSCLNHYWSTPNKLFEYMMAGLPMAGSDIPELHTFIQEQGLGQLFDPYSPSDIAACLSDLGRDPQRLAQMGREARRLAEERYCWEKESRKLLEVYQDLRKRP